MSALCIRVDWDDRDECALVVSEVVDRDGVRPIAAAWLDPDRGGVVLGTIPERYTLGELALIVAALAWVASISLEAT